MNYTKALIKRTLIEKFSELVHSGRIPHAILIQGPDGGEGLLNAIAFIQLVMCNNSSGSIACGKCPNCSKVQHLAHPDLHFVYPVIGSDVVSKDQIENWRQALEENIYLTPFDWQSKLEGFNKQLNINKKDCKSLLNTLHLKSYQGSTKAAIIWQADRLGQDGNRLLKIIEEPPEDTILILVATETEKVLPTILSRCLTLHIPRIDVESMSNYLVKKFQVTSEKAITIAEASDGDIALATSMLGNTTSQSFLSLRAWINLCKKGKPSDLLDLASELGSRSREEVKHQVNLWLSQLSNLLKDYANSGITDFVRRKKAIEKLDLINNILNTLYFEIERNAMARLAILNASLALKEFEG
jgi:DNA polymerase-3 subunit delta'